MLILLLGFYTLPGMSSVVGYLLRYRRILHLLRDAYSFLIARSLSQNGSYVSRIRTVIKFK